MPVARCLSCNLLLGDHRRSMLAVSRENVKPVAGFKLNLYQCISTGGPKLPRVGGKQQLGEGRSSYPPHQMR